MREEYSFFSVLEGFLLLLFFWCLDMEGKVGEATGCVMWCCLRGCVGLGRMK